MWMSRVAGGNRRRGSEPSAGPRCVSRSQAFWRPPASKPRCHRHFTRTNHFVSYPLLFWPIRLECRARPVPRTDVLSLSAEATWQASADVRREKLSQLALIWTSTLSHIKAKVFSPELFAQVGRAMLGPCANAFLVPNVWHGVTSEKRRLRGAGEKGSWQGAASNTADHTPGLPLATSGTRQPSANL